MSPTSRLALSLGALASIAAAPPVAADPSTSSAIEDNARSRIEAQGAGAMERMRAAVARRRDAGRSVPAAVPAMPALSPDLQRRAFQGLRARVTRPDLEARARSAAASGHDALQAQREAMGKRLAAALGLDKAQVAATGGAAATAATVWTPVLFASSSMPVQVLRNYAAQLERVGGVIAFRGVPGGMRRIAPLAKLTAEVLRLDPGCSGPNCVMRSVQFIVDPIVFRQHGVARVPALAMIPGDPTKPYCEREDDSPRALHVVYGDAALSGLLDEYARLGGEAQVRAAQRRLAGASP